MRRLARSTASQSQTLRRRWPTKVHISSSSSASHSWRWAFFGRKRGKGGRAACAFFYQFGHRHARHAGCTRNAALRVALDQELFHLPVANGSRRRCWLKPGLVPAGFALVLGVAGRTAVAPNLFAAVRGTQVLCYHHKQKYGAHLKLDHRPLILRNLHRSNRDKSQNADYKARLLSMKCLLLLLVLSLQLVGCCVPQLASSMFKNQCPLSTLKGQHLSALLSV